MDAWPVRFKEDRPEYNEDEMHVVIVLYNIKGSRVLYLFEVDDGEPVLTSDTSTAMLFWTMTECQRFLDTHQLDMYFRPKVIPL